MANVTFCIRMDEDLKNKFENMCESFGISMTAAINMFATAVVNERRIPFEIKAKHVTREEAIDAFESMRAQMRERFPNGMTLDEINELIAEVRAEYDYPQ